LRQAAAVPPGERDKRDDLPREHRGNAEQERRYPPPGFGFVGHTRFAAGWPGFIPRRLKVDKRRLSERGGALQRDMPSESKGPGLARPRFIEDARFACLKE
jgi:hypothetical protein